MSATVISHYRVIKRLGEGGRGEVFLAEDTKLRRLVALKTLRADARASPEARARLHEGAGPAGTRTRVPEERTRVPSDDWLMLVACPSVAPSDPVALANAGTGRRRIQESRA